MNLIKTVLVAIGMVITLANVPCVYAMNASQEAQEQHQEGWPAAEVVVASRHVRSSRLVRLIAVEQWVSGQSDRLSRGAVGARGEMCSWLQRVQKKRDGAAESQASTASAPGERAMSELSAIAEEMCCAEYPGCRCVLIMQ